MGGNSKSPSAHNLKGNGSGRIMKKRKMGGPSPSPSPRDMMKKNKGGGSGGIEKKVKTLKRLVPNGESKGFDGLINVTADYIVCLQMKVKAMQMMIHLLSSHDDAK